MNKEQAARATRNGALVSFIIGAITWGIVSYAINRDTTGAFAYWNDSIIYIDAVSYFIGACAMYFKSRIASTLVFFSYASSKVMIAFETDMSFSLIHTLLMFALLFVLGKAVYGSFVYHRIKRQENPDKKTSKWAYAFGIPVALTCSLLLVFAVCTTIGVVPSTRVLADSELRGNEVNLLRENNIVSARENITHFYSEGLFSILEGGSVLTDDRVISYYTDENDQLFVYDIDLADVSELEMVIQGSSLEDSYYKVYSRFDGDWVGLYLSVEQKGDALFVEKIRASAAKNERLSSI